MKKTGFHLVKREPMVWYKNVFVRAIAIVASLLVSAVVITILTGKNPLEIYASMISGAFGSSLRIWSLVQNVAILLCISLAVTPAFKMKFWNCGAEGQVLISGLATTAVMMFLGDSLPYPVLIAVMLLASILAGIIWAVIPAVFKALWNTNETLFTLMMNYVAIQSVAFFLKYFVKSGSGVLAPMSEHGLPVLFGQSYLLNIIIVAVLTVLVYIYLKKTKHGYEISVVGESESISASTCARLLSVLSLFRVLFAVLQVFFLSAEQTIQSVQRPLTAEALLRLWFRGLVSLTLFIWF